MDNRYQGNGRVHAVSYRRYVVTLWVCLGLIIPICAIASDLNLPARPLITEKINTDKHVTLPGNALPEVRAATDLGLEPDSMPMEHMVLLLRRPTEREAALKKFMGEQTDVRSPNYHHWLTPQEFGDRFGLAQEDLKSLSSWLKTAGFSVHAVEPSGVMIDFSGTAGLVRKRFGAEIHRLIVNGEEHFSNISDLQIPAALAPAIVGFASLHDFGSYPASAFSRARTSGPEYVWPASNGQVNAAAPIDIATIYNLTPLFQAGFTGAGVTIATVNISNMGNVSDWNLFRSTFGLSNYSQGSISVVHPGACTDPGVVIADQEANEATLDVEMATTTAPNASIMAASCQGGATNGIFLALSGLINQPNPPNIISLSRLTYSEGSGQPYIPLFEQAVSEGVSIFVSSGDTGASSTGPTTVTVAGFQVNGLASNNYVVAVGGTQFYGSNSNWDGTTSPNWGQTNSSIYGTALGYVPELPWNESCANSTAASRLGYSTTYGASGYCSSTVHTP